MAQELAVESSNRSGEQTVVEYESSSEEPPAGASSHLAERFGVGTAAGILLGAVIGVALMWILGTSSVFTLLVAVGIGFILSPVVGVLFAERSE
ncbi:hypothetical protein C499_03583 [Halogeometricum borinquense DSM 11551]|uniref:Glycine zipper-like domain-containing protein n=2 Tax=Halogeometricum borinquense TaxID=60847 RepID=E4NR72_HALBP|nr:hypothetical protein [Halogeometricum borinquense]ADQ66808.1 hypothetical protein Hbor_12190 [Halogeometricum borinquense DSM 11551]ELY30316.1 hypothetical protein C499_03583 [Halogeometricum borinquense DSM 11551]RYJ14040.1 hypothetical protein ELS19_08715 [Halogeometricum borinquense]